MNANLYHISLHPLLHSSAGNSMEQGGKTFQIQQEVKIDRHFEIPFDEFARKLTGHFDASYEYDGSFAFHASGESISGTIGSDEDKLAFVEIHGCQSCENLQAICKLLQGQSTVIQLMELGVFIKPGDYQELLH